MMRLPCCIILNRRFVEGKDQAGEGGGFAAQDEPTEGDGDGVGRGEGSDFSRSEVAFGTDEESDG